MAIPTINNNMRKKISLDVVASIEFQNIRRIYKILFTLRDVSSSLCKLFLFTSIDKSSFSLSDCMV